MTTPSAINPAGQWDAPGRLSAARWRTLSLLLMDVARGMEAAARLDAYVGAGRSARERGYAARNATRLDGHLVLLERRLDRELDRLTVERLTIDLAAKQQRAAGRTRARDES